MESKQLRELKPKPDIKARTETVPVEAQPFVVSPNSWMWKPWRPGLRPLIVPVTSVGPDQNIGCWIKRDDA